MFEFNPTKKVLDEATDQMAFRVESGEYAEADIGGASLVWDTDPAPYIVIPHDCPFYTGEPERIALCDYNRLGADLENAIYEVLKGVEGVECREMETEYDEANSNRSNTVIFHMHGVYAEGEQ